MQASSGKSSMLDTIHLKSQVIELDRSSRLPRPVERLESREWHAHPRHATVEVKADPGFLMTSQGRNGA